MTPNLSHFQPQSTTSNGSVSLDPSQKGVLMQLLRQNQHLMQLLVRRQLMQQPMSWTMEMHYPRSSTSDHFWIFDSGCFNHMSPYPAGFITKQPSPHPTVRTADLTPKHVLFSGNYSTDLIQLPEVLHVPGLAIGLVSLTQLQEMGLLISFDFFGCAIQDPKTKQILGKGRRVGRTLEVIYLRLPLSSSHTNLAAPISTTSSFDLWHARLGHLSSARIKLLANSGVLGNVTSNEVSCLSCKLGKHHALPFELNDYTSVSAFDLIHSDVWGPAPHPSMGGHRYFVIFIDDHTRFTWIYLMKHRSELPQLYINFARMIQTQFSKPIKILRADNAMEYKESSLIAFLRSQGTISQYSCPGTSPQNGRAERKHRHILDTVRTLLVSAKCPERFWGEAAFTAVYTINRHPTPVLQHKSPYEVLHGVLPTYELLKVWGCACFVQLQPHEYTKLEPRGRLCLFLGYGIEHKGYRCWDPISKRLRISRHVTFWEDVPFYDMPNSEPSITHHTPFFTDPSLSLDTPFTTPIPTPVSDSTATTSDPSPPVPTPSTPPESPAESTDPGPSTSTAVRRSDRVRQVPAHLRDYHCYATLLSHHEPTSYKEASSSSHWQAAMQEELRALAKAQTWDSVLLPPGKRPIGSKWVFKIKTKSDGSIDRYKARLVAKGFNQEYGIDYEETFAPVARVTSVRSLLAIAATKNWPLFQMDVKNAFLNGDLSEEVYMTPPPGVSLPSGHVCRLRKALYGLKQAPRAWFEKFSNTVLSLGFSASNYDSGLFTRTTAAGSILLLLYVDDMIITGSDSTGIASLKQSLSSAFEMKDLGKLHYFLGLEVLSDVSGTYLCQAKYISDLLSKAGLSDTKVASTPLEYNLHLTPSAGTPLQDPTRYRQLVGSLVYLTVTRPDIAYAVHTVSQFMAAPRSDHYAAVLRILRYLKGTMFHGLYFSSTSSLVLRGFSDADWDSDMTDRRSTTGYCFFLGDSLISWRSKKQSLTARSSTEAEYRALADTSQELIWLRWLLSDMGAPQKSPTPLWCDNNSAIQIAHNDVFHERTKHIEIDCHFVRQHVVRNTIRLHPISTLDQPADIFTKAHLPGRFRELVTKLNLSHSSQIKLKSMEATQAFRKGQREHDVHLEHVMSQKGTPPSNFKKTITRCPQTYSVVSTMQRQILSVLSTSFIAIERISDLSPLFFIKVFQAICGGIFMQIYVCGFNQICDIEIDKINKPDLPLAAGELTMNSAIIMTSFSAIMLPLLRWKRFPYTAVLYMINSRALAIPFGYYLHARNAIRGGAFILSRRHIFSIAMLTVFSVVLILFKDIPDIKGDEMHGIKSLASQIGPESMFWSCIWLLGITYGVAIFVGTTSSSTWSKYVTILGHLATMLALWVRSKSVDLKSMASISSMYLFLWKNLNN
ncbi:hypothetical protein OSB04_031258 [Centaurea solstitialis]|uniref:Integrase catalytic domain-containing protein n=1 Tax=Centaurea solstitialis TaxID=347529 RepID=A0AA38SLU2_9ASTR|nr:hypothetical protein OSB04_031258 [Centaurea solstitialis]